MIRIQLYYAEVMRGLFDENEAKLAFTDRNLDSFKEVLDKNYDYDDMTDSQICEMMFMLTNGGDDNNPLATKERQQFIRDNSLHTSLSIGDIVVIQRNYDWISKTSKERKIYLCLASGWEDLTKIPNIK